MAHLTQGSEKELERSQYEAKIAELTRNFIREVALTEFSPGDVLALFSTLNNKVPRQKDNGELEVLASRLKW